MLSRRGFAGLATLGFTEAAFAQRAAIKMPAPAGTVWLNANEFPADLRKLATSLKIETKKDILRAGLAAAILRELDENYSRVCRGNFPTIADEWEAHCSTIGREVVIRTGERQIRGRAESLDNDGALLLRTEHGHLERIIGGDVTLEK